MFFSTHFQVYLQNFDQYAYVLQTVVSEIAIITEVKSYCQRVPGNHVAYLE